MALLPALKEFIKYRGTRRKSSGTPDKMTRPELAVVSVPQERDEQFASLKPDSLKAILDDAAEGGCAPQAKLFLDMMEKDTVLGAHFETRRDAVTGCDMALLRPGAKMYEAIDTSGDEYSELWDMLLDAGLERLIEHLASAVPIGYMAAVTRWGPGGATILGWDHIHATNIEFDGEGNPALIIPESDEEPIAFADFHPNQFVLHRYVRVADHPAKTGLCRGLAWLALFKHHARKSWARFIEKFGIPFLIARISEADWTNETLKRALTTQLRNFSTDGAILTPEGGGVESVTVAGHHNQIHQEFVGTIDECFALAVLGQVGSSKGEPGRLGDSKPQDAVRKDKKRHDAKAMMAVINRQIVRPLWQFRHGSTDGAPIFVVNFSEPDDLQTLSETILNLSKAGYWVAPQQISYDFGLTLSDEPPPGAALAMKQAEAQSREKPEDSGSKDENNGKD